MEAIKYFLESSTIHGLSYISTTRKYVRLLWILIVISGFTGAGVIIYQSFEDWHENPVTTTIETQPITKLTFPKVTVCPPKNTYTNLNNDIIMSGNTTLSQNIRKELETHAMLLLSDQLYNSVMKNLSLISDNKKYYNWYNGFTKIQMPYHETTFTDAKDVTIELTTYDTSGSICTQYFGDKFDIDKMVPNIHYLINVYTNESVRNNANVTLHFDIEKMTMNNLPSGEDTFYLSRWRQAPLDKKIIKKYNPIKDSYKDLELIRKINLEDARKANLEVMPGFKFTWYYTGMEVLPEAKYSDNPLTTSFRRNDFKLKC